MNLSIRSLIGVALTSNWLVSAAMASDIENMRSLPVNIFEVRIVDAPTTPVPSNQINISFVLKGNISEVYPEVHESFPWIVIYRDSGYGEVGTYYNAVREDNRILGCANLTARSARQCNFPIGTISIEGFFLPSDGYKIFANKVLNQPPLWMKVYCVLTSLCSPNNSSWFEFGLRENTR